MQVKLRQANLGELAALITIDDAASALYEKVGLHVHFDVNHPFVVAEVSRWEQALLLGCVYVAVDTEGWIAGFIVLGVVDGAPYLDQISVHPDAMRRGIGAVLLEHAVLLSNPRALWLTTYAHLPWNRPYYERHGFEVVREADCGAGLCDILRSQRAVLPDPDQRIVMVRKVT